MEVRDYNGDGIWSLSEIHERYKKYCGDFKITNPRDLTPMMRTAGQIRWIYPMMDCVIEGIEAHDLACAQIGVEFIEEDQGFAFGAILKSNTARALRRFPSLTTEQVVRIRKRVTAMVVGGVVPREYPQYMRLLRKVGVGEHWEEILGASPKNWNAERARAYILNNCRPTKDGIGNKL